MPFVFHQMCYEEGEISFRGEEKWINALKRGDCFCSFIKPVGGMPIANQTSELRTHDPGAPCIAVLEDRKRYNVLFSKRRRVSTKEYKSGCEW